ncbi:ImmA/IrrE family metallo-endopeptidase [Candidatus Saccharibacteria bacterium]|nr:ImmA/IrrE family metallo-endopeptidase [Candidatus Saccharibacteria bacterium]
MEIKVKAAVFRSLRLNRSFDIERLSRDTGIAVDELEQYDQQDSSIDMVTLEKLAKAYKKRWTIFLLQVPEQAPKHGNDNRSRHNRTEVLDIDLLNALDAAEYIIESGAELASGSGVELPNPTADLSRNPELFAQQFREGLKPNEVKLQSLTDDFGPLRFWKDLLTERGLYISEMGWETKSVRAFSIIKKSRAIIVLSTKEEPQPRLFSLLHELCHVIHKQSGICDLHDDADDVEALCNRFAAAFLMPENKFRQAANELGVLVGSMPSGEQVKRLRKLFGVSRLAAYRRLHTLGYISKQQYETIQGEYSDDYEKPEEHKKKSKGGDYYRNKLANNSKRFTVEAFDAYADGRIGSRTLSRMLGISVKNLQEFKTRVGNGSGIAL